MTQLFFSIDTALLAAIAYTVTKVDTQIWEQATVTLVLSFFGLLLSVIWFRVVSNYRKLIVWRYDQIVSIEAQLDNSHQLFRKEWDFLFSSKGRPKLARYFFSVSGLEVILPWFFFFFHVLIALILIIRINM